jgi:hypothetical protein
MERQLMIPSGVSALANKIGDCPQIFVIAGFWGFLRLARNRLGILTFVSLRVKRGNLIKRNELFIRDYHVASLLVMTFLQKIAALCSQ